MARRPTWLGDIYDPVELDALLEPNKGRFTRKGDKRSDGEIAKCTAAKHAQLERDRAARMAAADLARQSEPSLFGKRKAPHGSRARKTLLAMSSGEWLAIPDVVALCPGDAYVAVNTGVMNCWKRNHLARQPNPEYAKDPLQPRYLYRINAAGREWLERNPG